MEANMESIKTAQEKFAELIQSEFERIERMKADKDMPYLFVKSSVALNLS